MALFFYIFAVLVLFSAVMVIRSNNPVHSVLWLIFAFCNSSGLMVLVGAEFIAMMLIIIYVGAVAVLFLFVVMMLDINVSISKRKMHAGEKFFAVFMSMLFFIDLALISFLSFGGAREKILSGFELSDSLNNVYAIGRVLYTDFILPFQVGGIILFVAMIASISLTHRSRTGVKRQNVYNQLKRNKENGLAFAQNNGTNGLKELNYYDN